MPPPKLEWLPTLDLVSGKTYYYCPQTLETSWTIPLTDEVVSNQFNNDGNFLALFSKSTVQKKDAEPGEAKLVVEESTDTEKVELKRKRVSDDPSVDAAGAPLNNDTVEEAEEAEGTTTKKIKTTK